jgi:hypothetical protein
MDMTSLSPKSNFLMFRSLPYLLGLAIVILATTLALWKSIAPFSLNTVLEFVGSNWNTGIDFGNPYSYAVMQNPIGFQIWHELGYRGTTSWFWLHFFALLVSFVLILIHLIRIHGFEKGVIAYSVTTCTTIFAMLFGWIGSYDAYILEWEYSRFDYCYYLSRISALHAKSLFDYSVNFGIYLFSATNINTPHHESVARVAFGKLHKDPSRHSE